MQRMRATWANICTGSTRPARCRCPGMHAPQRVAVEVLAAGLGLQQQLHGLVGLAQQQQAADTALRLAVARPPPLVQPQALQLQGLRAQARAPAATSFFGTTFVARCE